MRHRLTFWMIILLWACGGEPPTGSGAAPTPPPPPLPGADPGGIRVTVSTEGDSPDPDGYVVAVSGQANRTVGANDEAIFAPLPPNVYGVYLSGLALNCMVLGTASRPVSVLAGTLTQVDFRVACPAAPPGSLLITVTTTVYGSGWGALDWFRIRVDQGEELPIAETGSLVINPIAPGSHTVSINLPSRSWPHSIFGCTVSNNTVSVSVPTDRMGRVSYDVTCIP